MVKEIHFGLNREFIYDFRKNAYGEELKEYIDTFDTIAHHFYIYDESDIVGMFRIIRGDESERFEIEEETELSLSITADRI
jgi:hypothetical protein